MADQLAAAFLPAYGNPVVHAPAPDARSPARGHGCSRAPTAPRRCARRRARRMLTGRRPSRSASTTTRRELPAADAHARPPPARRRLPHGARRQDALRRPRPAARLRGAADHRRLPGRLRLDAGLAAGAAASACPGTTTCRACSTPAVREAAMQTDYDDEVCFRAVAAAPRAAQRPDARGRSSWRSRSRTRTTPGRCAGATGISTTTPRSTRRRCRRSRAPSADPHSLRLRDMYRHRPRPLTDARGARGAARLLRGGQLHRRAGRRAARRARGRPAWTTRRSSCSRPTTARCWASAASGTRCRSSRARRGCR